MFHRPALDSDMQADSRGVPHFPASQDGEAKNRVNIPQQPLCLFRRPGCHRTDNSQYVLSFQRGYGRLPQTRKHIAFEPVQDERIYIEKINGPFLYQLKCTPTEYKASA